MVIPSLSAYSVAALSIGGLKIDQALLCIFRSLTRYRNSKSTSIHNALSLLLESLGLYM